MSTITGILSTYIVVAIDNVVKILTDPNQSTLVYGFAVGVVFASGAVAVFLFVLIRRWRSRDGKKETTIPFYKQSDLPRLSEFLSNATELYFVGITLQELQQINTTITDVLRKPDGKVTVLVCDSNHKFMKEIEQVVYSKKKTTQPLKTGEKIDSTLSMLDNIKHDDSLSQTQINNLEIRTHNLIPTHTLLILDPNTDSAMMQVESYPFGIDREERRVFKIRKSKHTELFNVYWKSFQNMWREAASPVPLENPQ